MSINEGYGRFKIHRKEIAVGRGRVMKTCFITEIAAKQ